MRLAIVGHGSIGRRHAANARFLGCEVVTVDPVAEADVKTFAEIEGVIDAVVVATPSAQHAVSAASCIEKSIPVLVEKPMTADASTARSLLSAAVPVMVGYNLRHDESLLAFRERLPEVGKVRYISCTFGQTIATWRPGRDYRDTPAVDGILLEAAHELDLILWLFGPVQGVIGASLDVGLEGVREDSASALLRMESGATASLHLDMLRTGYKREIEVIGDAGTLTWTPSWAGPGGVIDQTVNRMYVRELEAFLQCVRTWKSTREGSDVPGVADAVAVHVLIEDIRTAAFWASLRRPVTA